MLNKLTKGGRCNLQCARCYTRNKTDCIAEKYKDFEYLVDFAKEVEKYMEGLDTVTILHFNKINASFTNIANILRPNFSSDMLHDNVGEFSTFG